MHTTGKLNQNPNIFRKILLNPGFYFRLLAKSQRSIWNIEFVVHGKSGHGSRFYENTPGVKMTKLLEKLNTFRDEEERKFSKVSYPYYGNITTINLTILRGGVQHNVIPAEFRATIDLRGSIEVDLSTIEQMVSDRMLTQSQLNAR